MPRDPALATFARVVLVVVGILPWLVPLLRLVVPASVGDVLDLLFTPVCHRLPARSLAYAGAIMPLCSRCAGIFAGFVTGGLLPYPRWSMKHVKIASIVAAAIMVADVVTQDLKLHPVWHPGRVATGVLLGHVMALGLLSAIRDRLGERREVGAGAR